MHLLFYAGPGKPRDMSELANREEEAKIDRRTPCPARGAAASGPSASFDECSGVGRNASSRTAQPLHLAGARGRLSPWTE